LGNLFHISLDCYRCERVGGLVVDRQLSLFGEVVACHWKTRNPRDKVMPSKGRMISIGCWSTGALKSERSPNHLGHCLLTRS
jgi:hypothetical protein